MKQAALFFTALLLLNQNFLFGAKKTYKPRPKNLGPVAKPFNYNRAAIETADGTVFTGKIIEKDHEWIIFENVDGEQLNLPVEDIVLINGVSPSKVKNKTISSSADSAVTEEAAGAIYRGTVFLDVASYGYDVKIEINEEEVYIGKEQSFSGQTKVKVGQNNLRVTYQPLDNPNTSTLNALNVKVRLFENQKEKKLIEWKAAEKSGVENLTFRIAGQPAGSKPSNLTQTTRASKGASSPAELIEKYKQAHQTKNVEAYIDLMYLKGVTNESISQTKSTAKTMMFEMPFDDITAGPKREGQGQQYTLNGVTYGPNLEITGSIEIKLKGGGNSYIPIGTKDGVHYIVGAAPVSQKSEKMAAASAPVPSKAVPVSPSVKTTASPGTFKPVSVPSGLSGKEKEAATAFAEFCDAVYSENAADGVKKFILANEMKNYESTPESERKMMLEFLKMSCSATITKASLSGNEVLLNLELGDFDGSGQKTPGLAKMVLENGSWKVDLKSKPKK